MDESDFKKWMRVFLPFDDPREMVRATAGDLIFDKSLAGRTYLKGLYLGGSASSKTIRHAYNFYNGQINRDRHKMNKPKEEAGIIAAIWAEGVRTDPEAVIPRYAEVLTSKGKNVADTYLVADFMSVKTAKAVFAHLDKDTNEKVADPFYYCKGDGAQVSRMGIRFRSYLLNF